MFVIDKYIQDIKICSLINFLNFITSTLYIDINQQTRTGLSESVEPFFFENKTQKSKNI